MTIQQEIKQFKSLFLPKMDEKPKEIKEKPLSETYKEIIQSIGINDYFHENELESSTRRLVGEWEGNIVKLGYMGTDYVITTEKSYFEGLKCTCWVIIKPKGELIVKEDVLSMKIRTKQIRPLKNFC